MPVMPQLRAGNVVRAPFGGVAAAMTDPVDIASVAAAALTTPGHENQTYHRELSYRSAAAHLCPVGNRARRGAAMSA
jgi:hypothetical protein